MSVINCQSHANNAYSRDQQSEAVFEAALDAVLVTDDQRRYVDANPAACALLGLPLDELTNHSVDDFAMPGDGGQVAQAWHAFIEEGQQQGEMSICLLDGSRREVEYSAKANFIPGYHLSILRDVTFRKLAEARLRESEDLFRSLVEAIPQQVWTAQPDGRLDYVSRSVLEYCECTFEAMIGDGWQHILHPDDVADSLETWHRALDSGEPYEVEFRLRRASDQSYRWHLGRALPLFNPQGQIVKWFGTNTDISDHKEIEQERAALLAQEQTARAEAEAANRAKDEFLAVVSHELRSPLNAILGWGRLLQDGGLEAGEMKQAVDAIQRNATTQARLIEDMLDLSRIILGRLKVELEPLHLEGVVQAAIDVVRPAAEARKIVMEAELDSTGMRVMADPHRLQQVVWNLLSNAIKFTPEGGRVEVRLTPVGENMQITVADTGQGISAEFLPHVFERLRQEDDGRRTSLPRSENGLGLGLAIVRYLVDAQGGTIRADSEGPGKGALFIVTLPRLCSQPAEQAMEKGA